MPLYVATMCADPATRLEVGDQISRRSWIRDENGVLTDPSTFEFSVRLPDWTVVSAAITHEGVGTFLALLPTFTARGIYRWRAQSAGLINQVQQGSFRVYEANL